MIPKKLTTDEISKLNQNFKEADPESILKWALQNFENSITLACSFGAEDLALLDMLTKLTPSPSVFYLDTGRLHEETYRTIESCRLKYGVEFTAYFPDTAQVEGLLRKKGPRSFYESAENRKECCEIRKVNPLGRALQNMSAWITGLRRDQSTFRAETNFIEKDDTHAGVIKINPLAFWTIENVEFYNKKNGVPVNPLHAQGYPSIGCEPCTRPVKPGEDPRSGRWWWENEGHRECGLHLRR